MAQMHIPILVDWDDIKDHMAKSDIVEVVRCEDCKYYRPMTDQDDLCDYRQMQVFHDDYCSRAEPYKGEK